MSKLRVFAVAMLLMAAARAAPPAGVDPDSPMAQWYRSLKAPNIGGSCCGIADCRPVEAGQVDNPWEVLTETGWQSVLPQRILHQENLDGRPIAYRVLRAAGGHVTSQQPEATSNWAEAVIHGLSWGRCEASRGLSKVRSRRTAAGPAGSSNGRLTDPGPAAQARRRSASRCPRLW